MQKLVLFIGLLPCLVFSQNTKWLPGEIAYNDGTTEKGMVEYKAWTKNPSSIYFSKSGNSLAKKSSDNIITLLPAEIKEVKIDGKDIYRGAIVTRYMNAITLKDLKEDRNEPEIREPVFLRLLSSGKILSLYTYVDDSKTHYFVLDSAGKWTTLRYVRYIPERTFIINEDRIYREQLKKYTSHNKKAEETLSTLEWRDEEMIKLVKLINNSKEQSFAEMEQRNLRKSGGIFAGAAMARISYKMSSIIQLKNNFDFKPVSRPLIYGGYRLSGGRSLSRLILQLSMGWYSYTIEGKYNWSSSGTPVTETMVIKSNTIVLGSDIMYNVTGNKKIEVEAGFEFNSFFPVSSSSLHTTTEINQANGQPVKRDQLDFSTRPHAAIGVVTQIRVLKKNNIRFIFMPFREVDDLGATSSKESLFAIGYHYFFGKK